MNKDEMKEDCRIQIRAAVGNLEYAMSRDVALKVLSDELNALKAESEKEPSDEFMRAVTHSGSLVVTCEWCNVTHFATWEENDYEDGELEQLRINAQKNPGKYFEQGDVSSISWGDIDGKQTVWGCPCNRVTRIESWIWAYRYIIADYLEARAKDVMYSAQRTSDASKTIRDAVEVIGSAEA